MNDLKEIYNTLLEFGENHNMVNQALFLMHESELEHIDIEFRCLVFIVSSSNLSRELNSPSYSIEFDVMVMDKVDRWDNMRNFESVQENIFVLGQLQDYMQQNDMEVQMEEIDLINESADDYNITSAASSISFTLSRPCYDREVDTSISIPISYMQGKVQAFYSDSLANANLAKSSESQGTPTNGGLSEVNLSDLVAGTHKMYLYSEVAGDFIYHAWCEGDTSFAMNYPSPYYKTVTLEANTMTEVEVFSQDDVFPIFTGLNGNSTNMAFSFSQLKYVDADTFYNLMEGGLDNGYGRGATWARNTGTRIGIFLAPVNDDL